MPALVTPASTRHGLEPRCDRQAPHIATLACTPYVQHEHVIIPCCGHGTRPHPSSPVTLRSRQGRYLSLQCYTHQTLRLPRQTPEASPSSNANIRTFEPVGRQYQHRPWSACAATHAIKSHNTVRTMRLGLAPLVADVGFLVPNAIPWPPVMHLDWRQPWSPGDQVAPC